MNRGSVVELWDDSELSAKVDLIIVNLVLKDFAMAKEQEWANSTSNCRLSTLDDGGPTLSDAARRHRRVVLAGATMPLEPSGSSHRPTDGTRHPPDALLQVNKASAAGFD
jgi:hypothetical protein